MAGHQRSQVFDRPASAEQLERTARALRAHGFTVELLDNAETARRRVPEWIPEGASVLTAASETLRLSGLEQDLNDPARHHAVKPIARALDRATQLDEMRRLFASPDVIVGSAAAVTETGELVIASATGSQLAGYSGAAARAIWVIGSQKVVRDVPAGVRRVHEHCLALEDERARSAYGRGSAVNRLLVLYGEPVPDRGVVLLLREAIGF